MEFITHNADKNLAEYSDENMSLLGSIQSDYHTLLNKLGQPLEHEHMNIYWVVQFTDVGPKPLVAFVTASDESWRQRQRSDWKVYATTTQTIHLLNKVVNL